MPTQADCPTIAVLIPAFNEAVHIGACLQSLAQQNYPNNRFEVVVIDNGSTDDTAKLVQDAGVRLLHEKRKSAYWARNLGIESTASDWVALTDSDCIADRNWLSNLVKCARANDAMIVGGLTVYEMLTDTMGNRLLIETHQPEQLRSTIENSHCVAGGNMFVKRAAFDQYGLFKVVRSGSDIEFSKRVHKNGHAVFFAEDAIIRHQCDLSDREYLRRSFRIRYGQAMHSQRSGGLTAAIKNLRNLPWRPGFRSGRSATLISELPKVSPVKDWLYRWANRWMGFLGEQYGLLTK